MKVKLKLMGKIFIRSIESSSLGNAIVLYDNQTNLFLDFGSKNTNIENYFKKYNVNKKQVAAALITHYHLDHIRSIGENSSKEITFYASLPTIEYIKEHHLKDIKNSTIKFIEVPNNSRK